jgi:hypothetical protein
VRKRGLILVKFAKLHFTPHSHAVALQGVSSSLEDTVVGPLAVQFQYLASEVPRLLNITYHFVQCGRLDADAIGDVKAWCVIALGKGLIGLQQRRVDPASREIESTGILGITQRYVADAEP